MQYYLAPMEGVTGAVFRAVHHRYFGGADKYVLPFITPTADPKFTSRQLRELAPEQLPNLPAVPQLMTKSANDFIWAAHALRALGFSEINLNLGCPSGTVVAKGKGAGFLAHPDALDRFLNTVFSSISGPISIKTRLGLQNPAEFDRLLPIFNRYPIHELTIHPRVRADFYREPLRMDAFAALLPAVHAPVCFNGELKTPDDCAAIAARFPAVSALMIGRALVADPALIRRARGGAPADRETLRRMHDDLFAGYCTAFGSQQPAVMRMKEYWSYHIRLFADSAKYRKRIHKARTADEYLAAAQAVFRDLALVDALSPDPL